MKKFIKLVLPIVLILAVVFSFGACSSGKPKKSENSIEGKWFLGEDFDDAGFRFPDELEFFSDGSMQGPAGGKYTISGDRIQIYYTAMDSYTYTFKIEDNMLKLVDSETGDYYGEYIYYREAGVKNSDSDSETTTVQEAEKLSASCDYILAQATDSKGNYIELVANDGQGYDGKRTIGLIKNNEWLVKMSSDTPFESIDVKGTYKLVKDNCFLYNSYILWNFENGKSYKMENKSNFGSKEDKWGRLDEKIAIISEINRSTWSNYLIVEFLNTDTMTIISELDQNCFTSVGEFSEGLFFSIGYFDDKDGDGEKDKISGYRDVNGNLVIDLSRYNFDYASDTQPFSDGKATFETRNEYGKKFEITIDKQGNVLSETAV